MPNQPEYNLLTEDELLHIAEDRDHLTDEARLALDAELQSRKLSHADLDTYRAEHAKAEKADQLKRARETHYSRHGVGKAFFGKANRRRDPSGSFEEYESTLWFVVFWFPVFPIAGFTVRRDITRWLSFAWTGSEVAIERHSRNWDMILLTWVKAGAVLLLIRLSFFLLVRHPEWLRPV